MRLKTFCGCLPLKTGVILMGSLTLVWSLASVIFVSLLLSYLGLNHGTRIEWKICNVAQIGLLTYVIVIGATGALMIHGARKGQPGFIFPWLARSTADLILLSAAAFTYILISPMVMEIDDYFIFLAIVLAAIALHVYVWLVVYSYYKQITVEKYRCKGSCMEEKIVKQPLNVYHHF